jgi:hypothetical protein
MSEGPRASPAALSVSPGGGPCREESGAAKLWLTNPLVCARLPNSQSGEDLSMKSLSLFFAAVSLATAGVFATTPSAAVAAAPSADISGTWTTSFDSQVGTQTYTYEFKVEGETLTGQAKSNLGEGGLSGTVDGDKVTFVENLDYQGQALAITYTGQIVSADEIRFKRDVAGAGGEEFTATRRK